MKPALPFPSPLRSVPTPASGTNLGEILSSLPAVIYRAEIAPDRPLETVARGLFDKADLTQRLATLERAIDGLGHGIKTELSDVREELSYLRLLLEDLHQVVSDNKAGKGASNGHPK